MSYINTSDIASDPSSSVVWLEKAEGGKVTLEDIKEALEEFINLFKAGLASKAEILTLARAFPNSNDYTTAALSLDQAEEEPIVIGGPASVELVDREGHLITTQALDKAFTRFMKNDRTRNVMVLHSDVQIGWALPAYISQGGQIFKSGVNDNGLFFICELRDDTAISKKVAEQIHSGQLKSYSIAGSATKVQNMTKGLSPYLQVDDMELAEVTVCEKGVNQGASFELLKAEVPQTGKVDKDQCGYRNATNPENELGINCGHCKYFNSEDKTCDVVVGDIMPGDYCRMFAPEEAQPTHTKKVIIMNSRKPTHVDFNKTFAAWMTKEDPLKSGKSFVTLENEAGRKAEHEQLLREYGFPSAQPVESMRYVPVVEVETDEDGKPIHNLPPWVVNEAGEALGDRLDEDAPSYKGSDKAKSRSKAKVQSSGDKEKKAVQKMGYLFQKVSVRSDSDLRDEGHSEDDIRRITSRVESPKVGTGERTTGQDEPATGTKVSYDPNEYNPKNPRTRPDLYGFDHETGKSPYSNKATLEQKERGMSQGLGTRQRRADTGQTWPHSLEESTIQKMGYLFLAEAPEGATYDLPYIIKHDMGEKPHTHDEQGNTVLNNPPTQRQLQEQRLGRRGRGRAGRIDRAARSPRRRTPLGYTAGVSEEDAQQHIDDITSLNREQLSQAVQAMEHQEHPLAGKNNSLFAEVRERITNAQNEAQAQRIFDHMHQELDRLPENRKRQNQEQLAKLKQAMLESHRDINRGGTKQTVPSGQTPGEYQEDLSGREGDEADARQGEIDKHKEQLRRAEEQRKQRWQNFRDNRSSPLEGGKKDRKTAARRMGDLFRGAKEGYGSFDPERRKFRDRWDQPKQDSLTREAIVRGGERRPVGGAEKLGRLAGQLGRSGVEAYGGEPISMLRRYLGRRRDERAKDKIEAERIGPKEGERSRIDRIDPDALRRFREQQERARRTPEANAELDHQRELGIGDARSGEKLNVHHGTFNTHGTHENLRNEHIAHHASGSTTKTLLDHLRHHDGVRNLDQDGVRFNNMSMSHLQGKNLSDQMSHGEYMQWFNEGQANGNIRNNLTAHGQQHDMVSHFMHADAGYEAGKAPKSLTPETPMPTNNPVPQPVPQQPQGSGFFDNSLGKSNDTFIEIIKKAARSSYEYR